MRLVGSIFIFLFFTNLITFLFPYFSLGFDVKFFGCLDTRRLISSNKTLWMLHQKLSHTDKT